MRCVLLARRPGPHGGAREPVRGPACGAPAGRGRVGRDPGAARAGRGLAAVLLVAGLTGSCLCPPKAEDLLATGFRTPRQTLESYKTFLRADLPAQEYLCFSDGFRERNRLSATTYSEGRERLFHDQPWMRLMAKAEVVGERSIGDGEHWFDVRVLSRTVRVKLVREGFFEILAGDRSLEGQYASFERLVSVAPSDSGATLRVRVPLESSPDELAGLSEVQVARHWKIDALYELGEGDEPLPPTPPGPQP